MKNKQSQKNTLKLKLIPYLAFRAKMLELNLPDLNNFINKLIDTNPFVEEDRIAPAKNANWEELITDNEDMYSTLIHQFRMLSINEKEKEIGEYIINNLTQDGYFAIPMEKILKTFNVPLKVSEDILKKVQTLEPPGIAARTLSECFILQLEAESPLSPKIKHILTHHLKELADEKYINIAKETGLHVNTLKKLRDKISHLTASPGLIFQKEKTRLVIPDIIITQNGDILNIALNKKFRRKFHINNRYLQILKEKVDSHYLKELADKARWAEKSIQERDNFLFRIGEFIVKNEVDFLKGKAAFPQKHTFDEISKTIRSDASAVSRLMQNKYVETPVGTFPLHFFVQHKSRQFNDEEVKLQIKEIVKNEDKKDPISDRKIVYKLLEKGISIKRRTVAKYRKILGIHSSNKRRVD